MHPLIVSYNRVLTAEDRLNLLHDGKNRRQSLLPKVAACQVPVKAGQALRITFVSVSVWIHNGVVIVWSNVVIDTAKPDLKIPLELYKISCLDVILRATTR
jgi:hypothetical protein